MQTLLTRRSLTTLFLALALMMGAVLVSSFSTQAEGVNSAEIFQLKSSRESLSFTLNTPSPFIAKDGTLQIDGLTATTKNPGAPALPSYSTLIALPPNANPIITLNTPSIITTQVDEIAPIKSLSPDLVKDVDQLYAIDQLEDEGNLVSSKDTGIYAQDSSYPAVRYELSEPMMMRDLRVARLTLYPVQYNPVQQTIQSANQMSVDISFEGADLSLVGSSLPAQDLNGMVMNPYFADQWRSETAMINETNGTPTSFPIGVDAYKIEVNRLNTGLYKLSYADLQAAGMPVNTINPNTFEMMHMGQPVSYIFEGNNNASFEPGERILFHNFEFQMPRADRNYIVNNIFWIWADGSASRMNTINTTGGHPAITVVRDTLEFEKDLSFSLGTGAQFDLLENEVDNWYWDQFLATDPNPLAINIDLPDPVASGNATYHVELMGRTEQDGHTTVVTLNGGNSVTGTWNDYTDVNISKNVPQTALQNGPNLIELSAQPVETGTSNGAPVYSSERTYLNRIWVEYSRKLRAVGNELAFSYQGGGAHEFQVSNFTVGNPANIYVLDTTNPLAPARVDIKASDISSNSGSYTYNVGVSHSNSPSYLATTGNNIQSVDAISAYASSDIEPNGNGAKWVAITYGAFMNQTNRLATHRASHSGLSTHIVNVEDVYNQYGYGFERPQAIKEYIAHAMADWSVKPEYVVLIGHATVNPTNRDCIGSFDCSRYKTTQPTYVVTDLIPIDRFLGVVPSDHLFSTVVGNDLLADLAVGRIAADSNTDLKHVVDKTIEYDKSVRSKEAWTEQMLFVADDNDRGGNFCDENNEVVTDFIPSNFETTELCLDNYFTYDSEGEPNNVEEAKAELRNDMINFISVERASILNYRGHGSVYDWAGGVMNDAHSINWLNNSFPTMILSADCLDGNFAWVNSSNSDVQSLSETLLMLDGNRGSAAHWSSSGLGYSYEHTALHTQFYVGLFEQQSSAIGDAVNYAKNQYIANGSGHISEVYAFVLQGDPALGLPQKVNELYLPLLTE